MRDELRSSAPRPSVIDRLFAGGCVAAFAVVMSSVGEAVYLYMR